MRVGRNVRGRLGSECSDPNSTRRGGDSVRDVEGPGRCHSLNHDFDNPSTEQNRQNWLSGIVEA